MALMLGLTKIWGEGLASKKKLGYAIILKLNKLLKGKIL